MNSNTITRLLQTVKNDLKKFMSSDKNSITKELDRAFARGDKETSQVVSKLVGESFKDVGRMLALVDSALAVLQVGTEDYTSVDNILKRVQFAAFDFLRQLECCGSSRPRGSSIRKECQASLRETLSY